ncbi:MAG TPA: IclR family transcriptional regulator [Solirubrobacterales bacterium]|nr:IclR family transcriptional regulator [Solirubrobacterales bacterium]
MTDKIPLHPIGSVENALRILVMLRDRDALRVSDAAAELGVARSTAHRLLTMLNAYEVVEQDPTTRAYRSGPLLGELGIAAMRQDDVLTAMRPLLEQLSEEVGETVQLMVLEGTDCRFVDSVECRTPLRVTARIGVTFPAHTTSGGKALLAVLDDVQVKRRYPRQKLAGCTEFSITSRENLLAELALIRERGYAVGREESTIGIVAVAVPLRTRRGSVPAALAVSAPAQRLPVERELGIAAALDKVATRAQGRLP